MVLLNCSWKLFRLLKQSKTDFYLFSFVSEEVYRLDVGHVNMT